MCRAIVLLLTGLLAGCVNQLAVREARLRQFIGQPEAALVQQMGVPNRVYETGGVKYLAYDEHSIDVVPGFPTYNPYLHRVVRRRLSAAGGRPALRDDIRDRRWHGEKLQPARQRMRLTSGTPMVRSVGPQTG